MDRFRSTKRVNYHMGEDDNVPKGKHRHDSFHGLSSSERRGEGPELGLASQHHQFAPGLQNRASRGSGDPTVRGADGHHIEPAPDANLALGQRPALETLGQGEVEEVALASCALPRFDCLKWSFPGNPWRTFSDGLTFIVRQTNLLVIRRLVC